MPRDELTSKQEAFCQHYVVNRNGAGAYRHAYDVAEDSSPQTHARQACALLKMPNIAARVHDLIEQNTRDVFDAKKALQLWLDIALADPDELIGMRIGACRYCWGEGNNYQWKDFEYFERLAYVEKHNAKADKRGDDLLDLPDPAGGFGFRHTSAPNPDCPRCEGEGVERTVARDTSKLSHGAKMLYGGLKKKKDGLEIIMADRTKALENANRIIAAFKDGVRLDASLQQMAQVVTIAATDPNTASKMYQDMIKSTGAVK